MAGTLDFVLGLEVDKFLVNCNLGSAAIGGLVSAGEMARKVFDGVFAQIEKGAALEKLSRHTGESVGALYDLQKAFRACGESADEVEPMMIRMQKALGGVNEMGESTKDVFGRMGLSISQLGAGGGVQALVQILDRLSKMSQTGAMATVGGIFGRMGAVQAVALSRSMGDFQEAFSGAAAQGANFARVAAVFEKIELLIGRLKEKGLVSRMYG